MKGCLTLLQFLPQCFDLVDDLLTLAIGSLALLRETSPAECLPVKAVPVESSAMVQPRCSESYGSDSHSTYMLSASGVGGGKDAGCLVFTGGAEAFLCGSLRLAVTGLLVLIAGSNCNRER